MRNPLRSEPEAFRFLIAVIAGAVRIFAPDRATKFAKKVLSYNFTMGAAAFWVIVGATLCYFGFRSGVTA